MNQKQLPPEATCATDAMIDAACQAVPGLYRVDAMRAIEAALAEIPNDRWVDARDISTEDGYTPRELAGY